jgi:hypothetical protein
VRVPLQLLLMSATPIPCRLALVQWMQTLVASVLHRCLRIHHNWQSSTTSAVAVRISVRRFGVRQRERLLQGLSVPPHMLLMSATPIPRTLALVQFGGLVLSTIASMPPGRSRVATQVVIDSEAAREQVRHCYICSLLAVMFKIYSCQRGWGWCMVQFGGLVLSTIASTPPGRRRQRKRW